MILAQYIPDLLDLIWFRQRTNRLQIDDFRNVSMRKDVMVATNAQDKAQTLQKGTHIIKSQAGISLSTHQTLQEFLVFRHNYSASDTVLQETGE